MIPGNPIDWATLFLIFSSSHTSAW